MADFITSFEWEVNKIGNRSFSVILGVSNFLTKPARIFLILADHDFRFSQSNLNYFVDIKNLIWL